MAYTQYKQGSTYFGYDPQSQQGIAFSNPQEFSKHFGSFDPNAAAPTFDTSKLMASPNQSISLAPMQAPQPPQLTQPGMPSGPTLAQPNGLTQLGTQKPAMPTYTPTPYTPPQIDTSKLSGLEQQYQQNLGMSPEEQAAQSQLYNLENSKNMGIEKVRNQPIPMHFITGQSESIARMAALQQIPLQQQLALSQAKRQAALEASRFALEREDNRVNQLKQDSRYEFEQNQQSARTAYDTSLNTFNQQQEQQQGYINEIRQSNDISAPFYKNPGSAIVYDSRTGEALSYEEYKKRGGQGMPGMNSFPDVQELSAQSDSKLLSVTEAARLGVPYGTTQEQAAELSKTPSFGKTSSTTTKTTTTKVSAPQLTKEITEEWSQGYIQGNGKISSSDYKQAKQYWTSKGLSVSSFDNQFGYLIDKSDEDWKSDYGYGSL